jgi:parallel beta-helix repeat protein
MDNLKQKTMYKLFLFLSFFIFIGSINAQTAPIKKKAYVDEQKIINVEAATPRAGYISAPYRKADGNWYEKTDAGVEQLIIDTVAMLATKYDLQNVNVDTINEIATKYDLQNISIDTVLEIATKYDLDTFDKSIITDGTTITGNGTLGNKLTLDTTNLIATKADLSNVTGGSVDTLNEIATKYDITKQLKYYTNIAAIPTTLELGERIKIEDTGAEYFIQNTTVADYNGGLADGVAVIDLGSSKYAVVQEINNYFNVKHIGAIGDGVTDDTDAILKALELYNSIFIPKGIYIVQEIEILTNNKTITGEGIESILKLKVGQNDSNKSVIRIQGPGIAGEYIENITLRNFAVNGSASDDTFITSERQTEGVNTKLNTKNLTIDNLTIYNVGPDGIDMDDDNLNTTITNNYIYECGKSGMHLYGMKNSIVNNNQIERCFDVGVDFTGGATFENENTIFSQNNIDSCGTGVRVTSANGLKIENNTIKRITGTTVSGYLGWGIFVAELNIDYIEINNNVLDSIFYDGISGKIDKVSGNTINVCDEGILISNTSGIPLKALIDGNKVSNVSAVNALVTGTNVVSIIRGNIINGRPISTVGDSVLIVDNIVRNSTTTGITIGGDASQVSNNKIINSGTDGIKESSGAINSLISNNHISNVGNNAIILSGQGSTATGNYITGTVGASRGAINLNKSNTHAIGNTITGITTGRPFITNASAINFTIKNNIEYNNGLGDILNSTNGVIIKSDTLLYSNNLPLRFSEYGSGTVTGTATKYLAVESDGDVIEVDAPTVDTLNEIATKYDLLYSFSEISNITGDTTFFIRCEVKNPTNCDTIGFDAPVDFLTVNDTIDSGISNIPDTLLLGDENGVIFRVPFMDEVSAGGGGGGTNFDISDGITTENITDGETITFQNGFSIDATNTVQLGGDFNTSGAHTFTSNRHQNTGLFHYQFDNGTTTASYPTAKMLGNGDFILGAGSAAESALGETGAHLYFDKSQGAIIGGWNNSSTNITTAGDYSFNWSRNSIASGAGAFVAGGLGNSSTGTFSFSIGQSNTSSSTNSFAGGINSTASNTRAFVFGNASTSSGIMSYTVGDFNNNSGQNGSIIGANNSIDAGSTYSIIQGDGNSMLTSTRTSLIGRDNSATDSPNSVLMGYGNTATTSEQQILIGRLNAADAEGNVLLGYGLSGNSYRSTVTGKYNIDFTATKTSNVSTDELFSIGKGTTTSKSNVVTILKNGSILFNASQGGASGDSEAFSKPKTTFEFNVVNEAGTAAEGGVLLAKMTAAQKATIPAGNLVDGMEIYCSDCTANDSTIGVKQVYQISTTTWKNLW